MGGIFDSLFGAANAPVVQQQPMAITQAAAKTTGTAGKQKTKDYNRRQRMALAGQQSTKAGGSMGETFGGGSGGATSGRTLMG
tara:strand:+ start:294 stop:542 length:249 start_codon:yes stop_codon:yes gene_type:complete